MSQQGPILVVSAARSPSFASALDVARLFPVVETEWRDAARAVEQVQPAAVLAAASDADEAGLDQPEDEGADGGAGDGDRVARQGGSGAVGSGRCHVVDATKPGGRASERRVLGSVGHLSRPLDGAVSGW